MTQEESPQAPELETASANPQPQQPMTDKFEMLVAKARKPVKQPIADPFDGIDKNSTPVKGLDLALPEDRFLHLFRWAVFWLVAWAGTALAGGLFGGMLFSIGLAEDALAPLYGLFFGLLWAGGVGLLVFLHVGFICWTFWCLNKPIVVVTSAGLLVGLICGVFVFSIVTGPMGAFGAYLTATTFLKTYSGKEFLATIELAKKQGSNGRFTFSTTDLLLRMTAISVMIAGWTAWINFNT